MTINAARTQLIAWTKKLLAENVITNDTYCLSVRTGECMLITPAGLKADALKPADLVEVKIQYPAYDSGQTPAPEYILHAELYQARPDFAAIVHSYEQGVLTASRAGKTVPPLLDDFAQIAGVDVKCTTPAAAIRKIRHRHAVLLKDDGALCCASTLDDAHAVAMVVEKNCKAVIETCFLGGGKKINGVEAFLMRKIYLLKYSKANETNK